MLTENETNLVGARRHPTVTLQGYISVGAEIWLQFGQIRVYRKRVCPHYHYTCVPDTTYPIFFLEVNQAEVPGGLRFTDLTPYKENVFETTIV